MDRVGRAVTARDRRRAAFARRGPRAALAVSPWIATGSGARESCRGERGDLMIEEPYLSVGARNVNWLVDNFVERTPGVSEAVVVASDGLPMAMSRSLDRDSADRFAAVAAGLIGLAYGAAGRFGGGSVNEIIVEMENAFLFVTGISDGSCLAVVADAGCDPGLVGYEMAVLVERAGSVLTPELRAELQGTMLR